MCVRSCLSLCLSTQSLVFHSPSFHICFTRRCSCCDQRQHHPQPPAAPTFVKYAETPNPIPRPQSHQSFLQPCPWLQRRNFNFFITHRHAAARASLLFGLTCVRTGTQTAALSFVGLSGMGLLVDDMAVLCDQLLKFPALKDIDLSVNPSLDSAAVARIVTRFSGKATRLLACACFELAPCCLHHTPLSCGSSGTCVGTNLTTLDLGGSSIEELPVDLMKCLPNLKTLKLSDCKSLCFLPSSLSALTDINIDHCSSLAYPPQSCQNTPERTLQFLRSVSADSEIWRRLKVLMRARLPQLFNNQ